ncbi:aminotransferase class III-fold pyridoxal phosphate-dependent enzyme [Phenylobacterium sp.]|uniref:aminotransferase class III-fold pyridoxal phosphate-dependent enzyme n=1 Tax=Phenylobacterium sp. TaxID=1871053 RepID=UPI0035AD9BDF
MKAQTGGRKGLWPQHARSGSWLTDEKGGDFIAWHCAGGTFNLGFCAPEIRDEMVEIIRSADAGLWSLPSERRDAGEAGFKALLPSQFERVYFTPSASEAFEVACKLAKRFTRRPNLVSVSGGYYGHIGFSLAMDDPSFTPELYAPLAGPVAKARYGSVAGMEALVDEHTAAVCIEPVQVPAGVFEAPDGYLQEVRRICDERGALLIYDEVQGGLLRTGDIWAFERHGAAPDILVSGKGMSGGYYPVGAVSCSAELFSTFFQMPPVHISSFSGGEIGAAISGVVARRYADPALAAHVTSVGARLKSGLEAVMADHPEIFGVIRGRGLLYGIDLRTQEQTTKLSQACWRQGLYVRGTSMSPTLTVQPPLVITAEEVDESLVRFARAAAEVAAG